MKFMKTYRNFDEFERDEIMPGRRAHFTIDEFVDEIFVQTDFEFDFASGGDPKELDFDDE